MDVAIVMPTFINLRVLTNLTVLECPKALAVGHERTFRELYKNITFVILESST